MHSQRNRTFNKKSGTSTKKGPSHFKKAGYQNKGGRVPTKGPIKRALPAERKENRIRICKTCSSTRTYINKNGIELWYKFKKGNGKGYQCSNCYQRIINSPKSNHKRVVFKDKRIRLKEVNRIGKCTVCSKGIGDSYINWKGEKAIIKRLNLHHVDYIENEPLKYTVIVCCQCHAYITRRIQEEEEKEEEREKEVPVIISKLSH